MPEEGNILVTISQRGSESEGASETIKIPLELPDDLASLITGVLEAKAKANDALTARVEEFREKKGTRGPVADDEQNFMEEGDDSSGDEQPKKKTKCQA